MGDDVFGASNNNNIHDDKVQHGDDYINEDEGNSYEGNEKYAKDDDLDESYGC